MRDRFVVLMAMSILLVIVVASAQNRGVATFLFFTVVALMLYLSILAGIGLHHKNAIERTAKQRGPLPLPSPLPYVSIIVPCKNEERVIATTIANLRTLEYGDRQNPAYEILVVDDGSTDRTYSVISKLATEDPVVQAMHRRPGSTPGKAAVLNDALTRCRGQFIAVFDADARIAPDFLQYAIAHFSDPKLAAIQAQKRTINAYEKLHLTDIATTIARPRRWTLPYFQEIEMLADGLGQVSRELQHGNTELRGNGQIFRHEAVMSVDGWNNETLVDDLDMSTRLHLTGWEIHFAPEIVVWEEGVVDLRSLWKQRRRWAEGSIRRHLDFTADLVTAPIPWSKKIDDLIFVGEFTVTPWMTLSVLVALMQFALTGDAQFFPVLVAASTILLAVPPSVAGILNGLTRNPVRILIDIPLFILYITHWPLVVTYTLAMIILRRRRFVWAKTEHAGHAS